jgi:hypothetical protein
MRVFYALLLSSALWAQGISLGLRSSVNITPQFAAMGPQQAPASPFTIGPLIEDHLWRGTALRVTFCCATANSAFGRRDRGRGGVAVENTNHPYLSGSCSDAAVRARGWPPPH